MDNDDIPSWHLTQLIFTLLQLQFLYWSIIPQFDRDKHLNMPLRFVSYFGVTTISTHHSVTSVQTPTISWLHVCLQAASKNPHKWAWLPVLC